MQTLAPQEAAVVGRARTELEGLAVRLRRSIAAAAAITVTSTEISSLELKPIAVDIDGPLVLWDAAGREQTRRLEPGDGLSHDRGNLRPSWGLPDLPRPLSHPGRIPA